MKTILIVDDFANTIKVVEYTLKRIEHQSLTACNGKEALTFFDGRKIDLLITDLNMPLMNGIELVREVRKKSEYLFLPIIMLTTERDPEKRQMAEDVKVTTWVKKPFDIERFYKIALKCLK